MIDLGQIIIRACQNETPQARRWDGTKVYEAGHGVADPNCYERLPGTGLFLPYVRPMLDFVVPNLNR